MPKDVYDNISCAVICVSGANFSKNSSSLLKFISELTCLEEATIYQIIYGFSFNSFLLIVDECNIHSIVDKIHRVIRKIKK